ncbi:c-type cytochrome [Bradyrhizobium elkanii]|uniref:Cytochrome c553 n=1 Tax=Bradyrhizobium elkanii TaxID=29448 RepID=A0ABV4F0B6_BRAEL|nr:c-type cytochrome [Bradyrhizobium elkanii]MCP1757463.1 cytochrome c553 [Bradyrhizobium elkanii]MCP1982977.1 cytochrome c553 [Bradyrhizobium elkanii]MCS3691366.1 cytochrome c553 [Bradyrhizobium elkanii]MCS3882239.1 cytochrome c553 [Bradyrhizobium elkanii]MCS4218999.1 cytochrome c553 [Bradyrhizobium elkanii]
MKNLIASLLFSSVIVVLATGCGYSQEQQPVWAYPVNPPNFQRSSDDGSIRHVPGSTAGFTLTEVRDLFSTPDWHPEEHPPMPKIVAVGRKPGVFACGVCHRADGPGGPESSSLFGLSAEYIIQQTQEFRTGQRSGSASRVPTDLMIKESKAVTDQELAEAAAYFSAVRPRANLTVLEADTVPRTEVRELFLTPVAGTEQEPIGQRIIELPESLEDYISRDSHARFVAYVPRGSIEKGKTLATTRDTQCATCHGEGLRGTDLAPRIAGRSPTYLFRQLYDFKSGARNGTNSGLMKPIVEPLSINDMIALAAYAGSLAP